MRNPAERIRASALAIHAALLLFLLMLLFPRTFLLGEMAVPGTILYEIAPWKGYAPPEFNRTLNNSTLESLTVFAPWYSLTRQALRNGQWPLWNPFEFGGIPLLANYQSAPFYPPHLAHTFMNVYRAMTFYALLKLWLCGMTAYLCGRGMGFREGSARFLSIAWMLSGFNVLWCYWPVPDVTAWLPLLFLGCEYTLDGRFRKGFYTLAVGAAFTMLAGHPESAFTMSLMTGVYFVLRLILDRCFRGVETPTPVWKPLAVAGGAWLAALPVCAAQLAPFIEYLGNSGMLGSDATSDMQQYYLPIEVLAAVWVPRFFGATPDGNFWGMRNSTNVSILYAGIAVWLGAALLLSKGKWLAPDRNRVIGLGVAAGIALCLAFNFSLGSWINRLPVFSSMRGLYNTIFPMWALPLLAAMGLERWSAQPRRLSELACQLPALAIPACIVGGLYSFLRAGLVMEGRHEYLLDQFAIAAIGAGLCLAALVLSCVCRRPSLACGLLTVLLAADLVYEARDFLPTSPRSQIFPQTRLTRFLQDQPQPCRISLETTTMPGGVLSNYGIEELWGRDGILPERVVRMFRECHSKDWWTAERLCSVGLYLRPPGLLSAKDKEGRFDQVATLDDVEVSRRLDALPRAFLVGRVLVVSDADALFKRLLSPDYDPSRVALTEMPPAVPLPDSDAPDLGTASIRERDALRVCVDVAANAPCCLVLTDTYYPGWRVTIDGQPSALFPAYYAFRAVVVPPGNHVVQFEYRPRSFAVGLGLSILAMLAWSAYAIRLLLKSGRAAGRPRNSIRPSAL